MPARQFFSVKKAGSEIRHNEFNSFLFELCDVAAVPGLGSEEYIKDLKNVYEKRLVKDEREKVRDPEVPVFDATDPAAAQVLMAMLGQNSKGAKRG